MKSIFNNNEYFSDHYLNASLAGDCKELLDKWTAMAKQENAGLTGAAAKARTPNEILKGDKGLRSKWERTRAESFSEDTVGAWAYALLTVLGYTPQEQNLTILLDGKDEYSVPCMLATPEALNPRLVAFVVPGTDDDAMQLPSPQPGKSWAQLIDDLFNQPQHPRWCLFIQGGCVTLIDYNKWFDKRTLTFCFDELYGAQVDEEYRLTTALLHADALCPHTGSCLLDTLTDNSHKNAHAVSTDLKKALQECIQLLGNEYVWYKRHQTKDAVYASDTDEQAKQIALECLRFMYRLLFCFYLESRPELRFLPMGAEPYLRGYSVDFLRDCEEIQLDDEQARNGYFLDASLRQLFDLIYKGREVSFSAGTVSDDFEIAPLKSHLFDPERTPLLSKAHFRNVVLQDIIRLLSIGSHGKSGRGRISYASLGLNQLGAVYENLLAYSGFFARDVLYEVKPAGEKYDPTVHAFFVTEEELQEYTEEERAIDEKTKRYVKHEKGEFIYRLAGRNRKNSASYYTPESLTKCTVQFSLKELLKDKCADDILNLKVCEMAVGSAAFLNEAINQLAEAYLRLKQKETGMSLSPEMYGYELQRVKMYIADRNVVGVDLNGTAVELAEVSLWLNTIYEGAFVPWFGMQLHHGNSLIGCKRAYWHTSLLRSQGAKDKKARWDGQTPTAFDWEIKQRPAHGVYHWLVPDAGMANYSHKNIKKYCKAELAQISAWRKEFMLPFSAEEIELALSLSEAADKLWQQHIQDIADLNHRTTDELTVWPHEMPKNAKRTSTQEKDKEYKQSIGSETSAYQRLQLAMDYWCALWFWPIEEAANLPSRIDFLMDMHQILNSTAQFQMQGELDFGESVQQQVQGELGFNEKPISAIIKESSRLTIVDRVRQQQHFFHWELSCAHIFHERAGFDLIVGNPPWIKVQFEEADLFSEIEPKILVRSKEHPADKVGKMIVQYIDEHSAWCPNYVQEASAVDAMKNMLNSTQVYPHLQGLQPNLYLCFITRAWDITNCNANIGFIHPDDFYSSSKAGRLRAAIYPRLRYHFQFENQLGIFEIGGTRQFGINVYGLKDEINFDHICNLFSPKSLIGCYDGLSHPELPENIKTDDGHWSVTGHPLRVISITEKELSLFASLLDEEGTPASEASLARLHTSSQLRALEKIAACRKISLLGDMCFSSSFWDETNSRKDGTIQRKTRFSNHLMLSGPHMYVANPCYKTPREICKEKSDYDVIDLDFVPDDYLARTNYTPACGAEEYERRCPKLPWNSSINFVDSYKIAFRRMLAQSGERTLASVLTCAGTAHVNTVRSLTTAHSVDMLAIASITQSLIGDYYIKLNGASDLHYQWKQLPLLPPKAAMNLRVLALNCLTVHYDAFWREVWQDEYRAGRWYGDDARLPHDFWANLTPHWQRHCALRNDFARRWALCELDVLVAREIGLTLEELCEAYRIQFPVMRQYEADTWYDCNGRVVFTCSKGLVGLGLDRKTWESIKEKPAGFTYAKTYTDNTLPTGPVERTIVYEAPFDRRDREVDYATIWAALDAEENTCK